MAVCRCLLVGAWAGGLVQLFAPLAEKAQRSGGSSVRSWLCRGLDLAQLRRLPWGHPYCWNGRTVAWLLGVGNDSGKVAASGVFRLLVFGRTDFWDHFVARKKNF